MLLGWKDSTKEDITAESGNKSLLSEVAESGLEPSKAQLDHPDKPRTRMLAKTILPRLCVSLWIVIVPA